MTVKLLNVDKLNYGLHHVERLVLDLAIPESLQLRTPTAETGATSDYGLMISLITQKGDAFMPMETTTELITPSLTLSSTAETSWPSTTITPSTHNGTQTSTSALTKDICTTSRDSFTPSSTGSCLLRVLATTSVAPLVLQGALSVLTMMT